MTTTYCLEVLRIHQDGSLHLAVAPLDATHRAVFDVWLSAEPTVSLHGIEGFVAPTIDRYEAYRVGWKDQLLAREVAWYQTARKLALQHAAHLYVAHTGKPLHLPFARKLLAQHRLRDAEALKEHAARVLFPAGDDARAPLSRFGGCASERDGLMQRLEVLEGYDHNISECQEAFAHASAFLQELCKLILMNDADLTARLEVSDDASKLQRLLLRVTANA